jgi:hypothetical protein
LTPLPFRRRENFSWVAEQQLQSKSDLHHSSISTHLSITSTATGIPVSKVTGHSTTFSNPSSPITFSHLPILTVGPSTPFRPCHSLACPAAQPEGVRVPIPLGGPIDTGAVALDSVSLTLPPLTTTTITASSLGITAVPGAVSIPSPNILISTSDIVETIIDVKTAVINPSNVEPFPDDNDGGVIQTRIITTTFTSHFGSASIPVIETETITQVIPPVPTMQSGPITILSSFTTLTTIPIPITLQASVSDGGMSPMKNSASQTNDGGTNPSSGSSSSSSRSHSLRKIIVVSVLCGLALTVLSGFAALVHWRRRRIPVARHRSRDEEDKAGLTGL